MKTGMQSRVFRKRASLVGEVAGISRCEQCIGLEGNPQCGIRGSVPNAGNTDSIAGNYMDSVRRKAEEIRIIVSSTS
jgi:hypothetical protein